MNIIIDLKSDKPLYIQVEEQLRKLIKEPEYWNGKLLPNEIDLSKQLGISRSTIRQALNKLVYEGLLIRKKGVGTTVAPGTINIKIKNWLSFSQEMKSLGIPIRNFELHVSWEEPNEELRNLFNIKEDTELLKLERLRGDSEKPFVYFISYFNPQIGMTGNEDFSRPLYDMLGKEYSIFVKLSREEVSARAADDFLSKKLRVSVGTPILKRKRFVFDNNGLLVEWSIGYFRADSFIYTLESERD
ncbi:HTH-type transcriptional repressor YvoA [termite gut metagenome]|uniref:HTH-type transcriptional repressor YvoA n=1 Tax=termite gut metagenome TaxID=433724 RepID=A0A5J4SCN1_9ZZZZ